MLNKKIIDINGLERFSNNFKTYIDDVLTEHDVEHNVGSVPTGDLLIDDISINRKIINTTEDNITLINNNYYKKTNISSAITISLNNDPDDIVTNYCIEFTTSISGTAVTLPSNIKWLNGIMPYFENDYTYQISIVNGLGVCVKFA
jgi:hypothetical protein